MSSINNVRRDQGPIKPRLTRPLRPQNGGRRVTSPQTPFCSPEVNYNLKLLRLLNLQASPYSEAREVLNKVVGYLFPGHDINSASNNLEYILNEFILKFMTVADNGPNGVMLKFDFGERGNNTLLMEMRVSKEAFDLLSGLKYSMVRMKYSNVPLLDISVDEEAKTQLYQRALATADDEAQTVVFERAETREIATKIFGEVPTIKFSVKDNNSTQTVNMRTPKISKEKPVGIIARLWQRIVSFFSKPRLKPIPQQELTDSRLDERTSLFDMEKNIKEWDQVLNRETLALETEKEDVQSLFKEGYVLQDRWILQNTLGDGGMGIVYKAWDKEQNRSVAVKFPSSLEMSSQIAAEAKAMEALNPSQGVVEFIGKGIEKLNGDSWSYYVMEMVEGPTLAQHLRSHPEKRLPFSEAVWMARNVVRVLRGLYTKDEEGKKVKTFWGDMKPSNILLPPGGFKAFDFIAYHYALNDSGSILGTPTYMSPEQARGEVDLDHRTDLYSLGILFYRMLAGKLPFSYRHTVKGEREVFDPSPYVTGAAREIIEQLTHPDPARRPDLDTLDRKLEQLQEAA